MILDIFQNQAKNIPVAIPGSLINIWGKSVKGILRYDRDKQSARQTNKQRLQL